MGIKYAWGTLFNFLKKVETTVIEILKSVLIDAELSKYRQSLIVLSLF